MGEKKYFHLTYFQLTAWLRIQEHLANDCPSEWAHESKTFTVPKCFLRNTYVIPVHDFISGFVSFEGKRLLSLIS